MFLFLKRKKWNNWKFLVWKLTKKYYNFAINTIFRLQFYNFNDFSSLRKDNTKRWQNKLKKDGLSTWHKNPQFSLLSKRCILNIMVPKKWEFPKKWDGSQFSIPLLWYPTVENLKKGAIMKLILYTWFFNKKTAEIELFFNKKKSPNFILQAPLKILHEPKGGHMPPFGNACSKKLPKV